MIEKSAAIKCPNIDLQLVTFKKVQEALSSETTWTEALGSDFEDLKHLFIGQNWGFENLTDPKLQEVMADCKRNPKGYVLKTQREGGGNNFFGDAIPPLLEQTEELWQYSLMKRIQPRSFKAILMKGKEIYEGNSVSELGIFG